MSDQTSIMIVDDHSIVREGLAEYLNKEPDFRVTASIGNRRAALAAAEELHIDVAIVDISLDGDSGIELIKDLRARGYVFPVLVLSMHDETLYAQRILKAGANGYLMKGEPVTQVPLAIARLLTGDIYLSPKMTNLLLRQVAEGHSGQPAPPLGGLTDQELDLFAQIGKPAIGDRKASVYKTAGWGGGSFNPRSYW